MPVQTESIIAWKPVPHVVWQQQAETMTTFATAIDKAKIPATKKAIESMRYFVGTIDGKTICAIGPILSDKNGTAYGQPDIVYDKLKNNIPDVASQILEFLHSMPGVMDNIYSGMMRFVPEDYYHVSQIDPRYAVKELEMMSRLNTEIESDQSFKDAIRKTIEVNPEMILNVGPKHTGDFKKEVAVGVVSKLKSRAPTKDPSLFATGRILALRTGNTELANKIDSVCLKHLPVMVFDYIINSFRESTENGGCEDFVHVLDSTTEIEHTGPKFGSGSDPHTREALHTLNELTMVESMREMILRADQTTISEIQNMVNRAYRTIHIVCERAAISIEDSGGAAGHKNANCYLANEAVDTAYFNNRMQAMFDGTPLKLVDIKNMIKDHQPTVDEMRKRKSSEDAVIVDHVRSVVEGDDTVETCIEAITDSAVSIEPPERINDLIAEGVGIALARKADEDLLSTVKNKIGKGEFADTPFFLPENGFSILENPEVHLDGQVLYYLEQLIQEYNTNVKNVVKIDGRFIKIMRQAYWNTLSYRKSHQLNFKYMNNQVGSNWPMETFDDTFGVAPTNDFDQSPTDAVAVNKPYTAATPAVK